MYKNQYRAKTPLTLTLITALGISAVFFSKEISDGIFKGMCFCAEILAPSIFPFMIIAAVTANSSLSFSGKAINNISNRVFGLSAKSLFAVILGISGGYPVGAVGINSLYKKGVISGKEAAKASYIAVGAGPGFLITFVGIRLLNSAEIGAVLFTAQIISVIILGIINRIVFGKENFNSDKEINISDKAGNIFIKSVRSAVYSLIEMCAVVCVFSAAVSITEARLFYNDFISVLLEVTTACYKLSESSNVILIAFAAGFGGLSVHFQIFGALGDIKINKLLFFLYRIIQGITTAFITYLFIKLFNITVPVFSSVKGNFTLGLSGSALGSCLLILTGICFLYSLKTKRED